MSLTLLDLNSETRGDGTAFSAEPVPPLRKTWIGFALALALLVVEVLSVGAGDSPGLSLALVVLSLAGAIYWLTCIQRFHTILRQISPRVAGEPTYPITPGQAVGYHFIPFYNLFWLFKWPMTLTSFLQENSKVRMMPGPLLGLLAFLGVLGRLADGAIGLAVLFVVVAYISGKLRQAVGEYESLRAAATAFN
jgi:hypothetical protein